MAGIGSTDDKVEGDVQSEAPSSLPSSPSRVGGPLSPSSPSSPPLPCFSVGDRVLVSGRSPGIVRFIGPTHFAQSGEWVGVELEAAVGKNDGSVKGQVYFSCPANHGVFVRQAMLSKLEEDKRRLAPVVDDPTHKDTVESLDDNVVRMDSSQSMGLTLSIPMSPSWSGDSSRSSRNSPRAQRSSRRSDNSSTDSAELRKVAKSSLGPLSPKKKKKCFSPAPSLAEEQDDARSISPRCSPRSPRSARPEEHAALQTELADAMENHDRKRLQKLIPEAMKIGIPLSEVAAAQHIVQFDECQSVRQEIAELQEAVEKLGQYVYQAEERMSGILKLVDNIVVSKVSQKIEECWYGFDLRIEKAIDAAISPAAAQFSEVAHELKQVARTPRMPARESKLDALAQIDFSPPHTAQAGVAEQLFDQVPDLPATSQRSDKVIENNLPESRISLHNATHSDVIVDNTQAVETVPSSSSSSALPSRAKDSDATMKSNKAAETFSSPLSSNPDRARNFCERSSEPLQTAPRARLKRYASAPADVLNGRPKSKRDTQLPRPGRLQGVRKAATAPAEAFWPRKSKDVLEQTVALAKIQHAVRNWIASKASASDEKMFESSLAAMSLRQKWTAIFKSVSKTHLEEFTFGEAIIKAHPSLRRAQADALWKGYVRGTQKLQMNKLGFFDVAEAVALGNASEFADMDPRMFAALGDTTLLAPATELSSSSRSLPNFKKIVTGQIKRQRESHHKGSRLREVVDDSTERQRQWIAVFEAHCKPYEQGIGEVAFRSALRKLHPALAHRQLEALWVGFTTGTGLKSIHKAPFCKIVEAVACGNDYACEFADVSPEEFEAMGMEPKRRSSLHAPAISWNLEANSTLEFPATPSSRGSSMCGSYTLSPMEGAEDSAVIDV